MQVTARKIWALVATATVSVAAATGAGAQDNPAVDEATGAGVIVAIIDSPNRSHRALEGRILDGIHIPIAANAATEPGWTHADDHGTSVAGVIAAGAPGATILPVSLDPDATPADVAIAIRWAVDHGAQVINASIALSEDTAVVRDAVAYAVDNQVLVVAGVGNSGSAEPQCAEFVFGQFTDKVGEAVYPAAYPDVLGVGGLNGTQRWPCSVAASGEDVFAPAVDLELLAAAGGTRVASGTSYAAPVWAAYAARLIELRPAASVQAQLGALTLADYNAASPDAIDITEAASLVGSGMPVPLIAQARWCSSHWLPAAAASVQYRLPAPGGFVHYRVRVFVADPVVDAGHFPVGGYQRVPPGTTIGPLEAGDIYHGTLDDSPDAWVESSFVSVTQTSETHAGAEPAGYTLATGIAGAAPGGYTPSFTDPDNRGVQGWWPPPNQLLERLGEHHGTDELIYRPRDELLFRGKIDEGCNRSESGFTKGAPSLDPADLKNSCTGTCLAVTANVSIKALWTGYRTPCPPQPQQLAPGDQVAVVVVPKTTATSSRPFAVTIPWWQSGSFATMTVPQTWTIDPHRCDPATGQFPEPHPTPINAALRDIDLDLLPNGNNGGPNPAILVTVALITATAIAAAAIGARRR